MTTIFSFSPGHKVSYDSNYDYVASENQPLVIMLILVYIQMRNPLKVKTSQQKNVNFGQTARMETIVLSITLQ